MLIFVSDFHFEVPSMALRCLIINKILLKILLNLYLLVISFRYSFELLLLVFFFKLWYSGLFSTFIWVIVQNFSEVEFNPELHLTSVRGNR